MPNKPRPTIHQTYVPFVEMYMHGIDILRSPSGKPRTLISFSHDIYAGAGGFWTLEIFDPSYVSVEELLVSFFNYGVTDVTSEAYAADGGGGAEEETINASTAHFRYGYVGKDISERVVSVGRDGSEYFYGSVHSYVPIYETNGARLIIKGDSAGAQYLRTDIHEIHFVGSSIYEVIEKICEEREWALTPIGEVSNADSALQLEKRPEDFKRTDVSVDNTEETPPSFKMRANEDHVTFINRLCGMARPKDPKYDVFMCRLEYRSTGPTDTKPKGILYFGPADYVVQEPVRQYIYMRDPRSDVISFSTNAQVWAAVNTGAAGTITMVQDAALGKHEIHYLDDINRYLKYDDATRPAVTFTSSQLEDAAYPKGEVENPEAADKGEGGAMDPNRLSAATIAKMSAPATVFPIATNDRRAADRESMTYWLTMQNWVSTATLQIIGDPSADIEPGSLVSVLIFVPQGDPEEQKLAFHWTSSIWMIVGVNHEIRPGQMITNLELSRTGLAKGGATTKAAFRTLKANLTPGQMKRTS